MPARTAARVSAELPLSRNKQHIGRCGELLVQYRLLLRGIESAAMTTDSGVDLVAYGPGARVAVTIQVKTNLGPKPGGGKGKMLNSWLVPETSPAQFHALVDLSTERIWLLGHREFLEAAQQHHVAAGNALLLMYVDPEVNPRTTDRRMKDSEFDEFLLERRFAVLFAPERPSR